MVALGAVHPIWSRCTCLVLMGYRRISKATNPDHNEHEELACQAGSTAFAMP